MTIWTEISGVPEGLLHKPRLVPGSGLLHRPLLPSRHPSGSGFTGVTSGEVVREDSELLESRRRKKRKLRMISLFKWLERDRVW
jgi:hypothetical protein